MEERKRRAQIGLCDIYLYGKNTTHVTFNEFVNRELILFSNMDNERSIPSLVDGQCQFNFYSLFCLFPVQFIFSIY